MNQLIATISHVIFYNSENNYSIIKVHDEKKRSHIVIGKILNPIIGKNFIFNGEITQHKSYGEQFAFESYEELIPKDEKGLIAFLSSGLFPGIGPVTATNIVKNFGEKTIEILDNNPERLHDIKGYKKKDIQKFSKAWAEQKEIRNFHVFTQAYDISIKLSAKIWDYYKYKKIDPITAIQKNPYELSIKMAGIGFVKADTIGKKLGFEDISIERIEGAVYYELNKAVESGHTCLPITLLSEKTKDSLDFENITLINTAINSLIENGSIKKDNGFCYLPQYYKYENQVIPICLKS